MEKEPAHKEKSESGVEGNNAVATEQMMESREETVAEDRSKDELTEAAVDAKPEAAPDTDMKETTAVETVTETVGENEGGKEPEAGNDKTPAGEVTNLSLTPNGKEASREMPELPKVK